LSRQADSVKRSLQRRIVVSVLLGLGVVLVAFAVIIYFGAR